MSTTNASAKNARRSAGIQRLRRNAEILDSMANAETAMVEEVARSTPSARFEEEEQAVYRSLTAASPHVPVQELSRRAKTSAALSIAKSTPVEVTFGTVIDLVNKIVDARELLDASQYPQLDKEENMVVPEGADIIKGMIGVAEKNHALIYQLIDNKPFNEDECPICLSEFETDTTLLGCRHKFCKVCIDEWVDACVGLARCPLCVAPIAGAVPAGPAPGQAPNAPLRRPLSQVEPEGAAWIYRSFDPFRSRH